MKTRAFYLLLPVFIFSFNPSSSQAQTDEGSFVVNGRTNLLLEFGENAPFTFNMSGGYFLFDNLALGVGLNFEKISSVNIIGVKPFARYYLFRVIFFGAGLRYDNVIVDGEGDAKVSLDLEVGALIMLTDQVGLEPTLRVPVNRDSNVALLIGFSFFFN